MMTSLKYSRRVARLVIQAPSIPFACLVYSIALDLSSLRADLLDIKDPFWVITIGLILLLSPLLHLFIVGKADAIRRGESFPVSALPLEGFGDLVLGQLLVNAMVVLGSALFLFPGIYVGLRTIYYKQLIILHKARPMEAIRASFQLTVPPRRMGQIFLLLAVSYSFPLAIDYWLFPAAQAWWTHPLSIVISTLFLVWVNGYVTIWFGDLVSVHPGEDIEGISIDHESTN